MKTEKFTELTTGYYKLVDKGGWLERNEHNPLIYDKFFEKDMIFIDEVIADCGMIDESIQAIIMYDEYQFFEKVIPEPRTREDIGVTYSNRIRVGMGKHFHEYLVVAGVEGKHYAIQYDGNDLPDGKSILNLQKHHKFSKVEIKWQDAMNIVSGINTYKMFNHNHVNAFSFLVGWCKGFDTDLYELGVFEV